MRTLIELAMIELAGKWARVPYWQCLTLDQTHPGFQRQLRDWYDEGSTNVHQALVKKSLTSSGYLNAQTRDLPMTHPTVRSALAKYQADQGMVVTGELNFATYERALRHYVTLGEDGQFIRVGWLPDSTQPPVPTVHDGQVTAAPLGAPLGADPDPLRLDVQVENLVADKSVFEQGTQIFLSATVSRSAHLYCFMEQSQGGLMRLLPNPINSSSQVSAQQAVRIPDWMVPNPGFVLDAGMPGEESVACFATDSDLMTKLPDSLQGPGLRPVVGMTGMSSVREAFRQAAGTQGFAEQSIRWRVMPRRAQAR